MKKIAHLNWIIALMTSFLIFGFSPSVFGEDMVKKEYCTERVTTPKLPAVGYNFETLRMEYGSGPGIGCGTESYPLWNGTNMIDRVDFSDVTMAFDGTLKGELTATVNAGRPEALAFHDKLILSVQWEVTTTPATNGGLVVKGRAFMKKANWNYVLPPVPTLLSVDNVEGIVWMSTNNFENTRFPAFFKLDVVVKRVEIGVKGDLISKPQAGLPPAPPNPYPGGTPQQSPTPTQ